METKNGIMSDSGVNISEIMEIFEQTAEEENEM